MTNADYSNLWTFPSPFLKGRGLVFEEVTNSFCLGLDGASWGFLNEDVAVLAVLEGKEYEVNGFFEAHNEAGHLGFGKGDGVSVTNLVYPERYDTTS